MQHSLIKSSEDCLKSVAFNLARSSLRGLSQPTLCCQTSSSNGLGYITVIDCMKGLLWLHKGQAISTNYIKVHIFHQGCSSQGWLCGSNNEKVDHYSCTIIARSHYKHRNDEVLSIRNFANEEDFETDTI